MPNDDYILRGDAISAFCGNCEATDICRQLGEPCEEIKRIKAIPAAEVVPAPVHCSDCRFYDKRDGGAPGGTGWCSRPGAGCGVPAEFFCAGAERREADNG